MAPKESAYTASNKGNMSDDLSSTIASNKHPKRDAETQDGLDHQALGVIGWDRDNLRIFQVKLEDAIEEIGEGESYYTYGKLGYLNPLLDRANLSETGASETNADILPLDVDKLDEVDWAHSEDEDYDSITDETTACTEDDMDDEPIADHLLVPAQINRAKQQLVDTVEHYTVIHAALDEGRVKPIFHSLLLPETFLNNRRSITEVTAGDVDLERDFTLEFYGINLDEVINDTGIGAGSIKGDHVKSGWEFSHWQTAFAVELVNTDAVMLGAGVEGTHLTSIPQAINPSERSNELFTRPESRGVVSNIFHGFAAEPNRGSVATITGMDGIGKSWTLFYALQQALLYDGATVLFFHQKYHRAVMYLRRNNRVYAWTSATSSANSNLFRRQDVLVLLDPEEVNANGAYLILGRMKLLYVANNKAHISRGAEKNNPDMQAYLGPLLDGELNVILKRLDPTLRQRDIEERKKHVGNLIRYVLKEAQYDYRLECVTGRLSACAHNHTLLEKALLDEGMSNGREDIAGTIFQVLPTRPADPTLVGYDGQEIKYRMRVVEAINPLVRQVILGAGRRALLDYWGITSANECSVREKVGTMFVEDLTGPNGMVVTRYLQAENGKWEESELVVNRGSLLPSKVLPSEIYASVLEEPKAVATSCGLISSVAGPGRKVYHTTVLSSQTMSLVAMESFCRDAGLIDQDGTIMAPKNTVEKVEFYWVVPNWQPWKWRGSFPYMYQGTKDDLMGKLVNECLAMHVDQYVLPMTTQKPITFSEWERGGKPHWW